MDALTDELMTSISAIAGRVRHREQYSLHLQGKAMDAEAIGKDLGAERAGRFGGADRGSYRRSRAHRRGK